MKCPPFGRKVTRFSTFDVETNFAERELAISTENSDSFQSKRNSVLNVGQTKTARCEFRLRAKHLVVASSSRRGDTIDEISQLWLVWPVCSVC